MGHRLIQGRIEYTSRKPERFGEVRGREVFTLSCQPDGTDVLLAHCEIDDSPKVVRDVCLALRHADSSNEVRLAVKLSEGGDADSLAAGLKDVELLES